MIASPTMVTTRLTSTVGCQLTCPSLITYAPGRPLTPVAALTLLTLLAVFGAATAAVDHR